MFLKRLFRKPAGKAAQPDQAALLPVAFGTGEVGARREACRRLLDLAALRRLADEDADPSIRDLAEARFARVLCGNEPQGPALAARLAALEQLDANSPAVQRMLAAVAVQSPEAEARAAALALLTDQGALAECALVDPLAANRMLAAGRLSERAALERVARGSAKRDKNVHRLVRTALKTLAEAEARPLRLRAEAESLCERLGRLGRFDNWSQDRAVLEHLDQQWAAIVGDLDAGLQTRYEQLRVGFLNAWQARQDAQAAKVAAHDAAAAATSAAADERARLLGALQVLPAAVGDDLAALTARLAELTAAWENLPDAGASPAARRAWADALAAARDAREAVLARQRDARAVDRLRADAEALVAAAGTPTPKALEALQRRRQALPAELGDDALDAALATLVERLDKQREQLARKCDRLTERLAELERLIEAGELRRAEPLFQSIVASIDQARAAGLPAADLSQAEAGLKRIAPRLKDLRQWRRWSTDEHREALCTEAETLAADAAKPLPALTLRLRELQQSWRGLERTGAAPDEAVRARFRGAIEQLQARCQPHLDELAARARENREAREALCEELETFLAQVDWTRIDWKRAARAERETRQSWAALEAAWPGEPEPGAAERRRQAPLEGRFRRALRTLDKALADERERNLSRKRELVAGMQALLAEPDLRRAIDAAKALQQQWHTSVPGPQREENALWQAFRAASDQVFARRAAEQEARGAELREHQSQREAICADLDAAVATCDDPAAIARAIDEQRRRWRDTEALPLGRSVAGALERQWQAALARAEARRIGLLEARREAVRQRLAARAEFCDDAARRLLANPNGLDGAALQARWAALAPAEAGDAAALEQAFATVLAAVEDAEAHPALVGAMARNYQLREELCLHLEITAGIPSPTHLRQQRMQLQVERLRERIGEGAADPLGDAEGLLQRWYRACPAAADPELDARFRRARKALAQLPTDAPGSAPVALPAADDALATA